MGRAVKPGGKVVIFWPHHRATSVFVLKAIHWLLNCFRHHGDLRCNCIRRRSHCCNHAIRRVNWSSALGFNLVEYYFGMRDLLVQAVIVGSKR